jgi:hypothetical protein
MNRNYSQNLFFAVAIGILSSAWLGCSQVPDGPRTVPAEGIITLDGEPISGAAIVFISDGGDVSANGISGPDGEFSLDAFPYKKGAVPGPYKCIVTRTVEITTNSAEMKGEEAEHAATEGGGAQVGVKNDLPMKYSQPSENFKFVVPEEGVKDLKLELTSK